MPPVKVTDAEICEMYEGGMSMRNIPAAPARVRRVLGEHGIPVDLHSRYIESVKTSRPPSEYHLSVKPRPPGAWIADVAIMTGGQLANLPRPLRKGASRTRTKLYDRRMKELLG